MHSYLKSLSCISARRGSISIAIAGALLTASCSKPIPPNRYDGAMELAKNYSIQETPKDFLATLGPSFAKDGYGFADLVLKHSFSGKFETAAEELDKQEYFQPDNRSLLEGIVADSKLPCDYNGTSPMADVDCGDRDGALPYQSGGIRLLHTNAGDFIFSSADMSRGNGNESNENASAVVVIVDPTDGGFGMILEDHIAIVGGRHDVIAAVLTLASSIIRLEDPNGSTKLSSDNLRFDLQAAKSNTLYKKPTYLGDDALVHKAYRDSQARETTTPTAPAAPPDFPVIRLSSNISFRRISRSEFQSRHPAAECFPYAGQEVCDLKQPAPEDCPRPGCSEVLYSFKSGTVSGFDAKFDGDQWPSVRDELTQELGAPSLQQSGLVPGTAVASAGFEWHVGQGLLSLTHFWGRDVQGTIIPIRYSITYWAE